MIYFYLECDALDKRYPKPVHGILSGTGNLKELKQRNMRVQRVICFFVCV